MHNNSKLYLENEKGIEFTDRVRKPRLVLEHINGLQRGSRDEDAGGQKSTNSDVVFLGWQAMPSGKVVPLYNIVLKNHPLYQSTVSEDTLRKYNLCVPPIPRKLEGSDPLQ
jgi:hypothetical protein